MTLRVTKDEIRALSEEAAALYQEDSTPWIVGYSGGKDSTATLQLVWMALLKVPAELRMKTVYVISTDTLVENPVIVSWQNRQHDLLRSAALAQGLPIVPVKLRPDLADSFWVNLIGKGYPAPRHGFRWCTSRLKINPSTEFIKSKVRTTGEVILCLGTRKAESSARARNMNEAEKGRVRDRLSPAKTPKDALVYSPIESWGNDDVWAFLLNNPCPWNPDGNKQLMSLYRSASADNECPIVMDTSTPSCGASRFGCWTCTLVEQDKSLSAMIENDPAMEWLLPLRALRDRLDIDHDRHLRDFRRMHGLVQIMNDGRNVPGPYHQAARRDWLVDLLRTEAEVRKRAPAPFDSISLIADEELEIIQQIWVRQKYELEDIVPDIVKSERGTAWPTIRPVPLADLRELQAVCDDEHLYCFVRDLWGARLFDGSVAAVGQRYQYRSAEEAVIEKAGQQLLFMPRERGAESVLVLQAAVTAKDCPVNDAPWVALAFLDRALGRPARSQQTPYQSTYYGDVSLLGAGR